MWTALLIHSSSYFQVDYGAQGLLVYTIHPGGVPTDMGLRMPEEAHVVLIDTAALSGDSIAFLTRDRREWLAGRYISCKSLSICLTYLQGGLGRDYQVLSSSNVGTWDMEELLEMKDEIVAGDKLKVRMVV